MEKQKEDDLEAKRVRLAFRSSISVILDDLAIVLSKPKASN